MGSILFFCQNAKLSDIKAPPSPDHQPSVVSTQILHTSNSHDRHRKITTKESNATAEQSSTENASSVPFTDKESCCDREKTSERLGYVSTSETNQETEHFGEYF